MKKFILLAVFCLAMCSFALAQSPFPELDKIKQIKLLESTRDDVQKILMDYNLSYKNEKNHIYRFISSNAEIEVRYSSGKCSDDSDEDWSVPEWRASLIHISLQEAVKPKDFGLDLSQYKRERIFANLKHTFKYHQKTRGIGYNVNEDGIYGITLIPSKENYPLLCKTKRVKKYYDNRRWFTGKLKYRIKEPFYFANVTELALSKKEITAQCITEKSPKGEICSADAEIEIAAKAESENPTDVLTYNYTVSGGKITGTGTNVTWNLTGVKPGKYTITAGVDNGCGVCGTTKTETVEVKDCPDCRIKEKL
jgi:hypothetical protein